MTRMNSKTVLTKERQWFLYKAAESRNSYVTAGDVSKTRDYLIENVSKHLSENIG